MPLGLVVAVEVLVLNASRVALLAEVQRASEEGTHVVTDQVSAALLLAVRRSSLSAPSKGLPSLSRERHTYVAARATGGGGSWVQTPSSRVRGRQAHIFADAGGRSTTKDTSVVSLASVIFSTHPRFCNHLVLNTKVAQTFFADAGLFFADAGRSSQFQNNGEAPSSEHECTADDGRARDPSAQRVRARRELRSEPLAAAQRAGVFTLVC